jgi:hypothetical protein
MNITFSTEALEPVPINSGWRGDYQPLDDGVTLSISYKGSIIYAGSLQVFGGRGLPGTQ